VEKLAPLRRGGNLRPADLSTAGLEMRRYV